MKYGTCQCLDVLLLGGSDNLVLNCALAVFFAVNHTNWHYLNSCISVLWDLPVQNHLELSAVLAVHWALSVCQLGLCRIMIALLIAYCLSSKSVSGSEWVNLNNTNWQKVCCLLIFELILLLVDIVIWCWSLFRINTYEIVSWRYQFWHGMPWDDGLHLIYKLWFVIIKVLKKNLTNKG